MQISFVLPCLNEERSLPFVIDEINNSFSSSPYKYEILIADNGSVDNSKSIALQMGARVIDVAERGYGAALLKGFQSANGIYIVMGDADGSYKFKDSLAMIKELEGGKDFVLGNRFKGKIHKDAMPFLHKYLGNPILSFLGRFLFKIPIGDFHCGLRAFNREKILELNLKSPGMEFASEMVVLAKNGSLKLGEVPIELHKDLRDRPPHLNTWRDGWRHLRFLLSYSPKWVFLIPGYLFAFFAFFFLYIFFINPIALSGVVLSFATGIFFLTFSVISLIFFWIFLVFRMIFQFDSLRSKLLKTELIAFLSISSILIGLAYALRLSIIWRDASWGPLPIPLTIQLSILSSFFILIGSISLAFGLIIGVIRSRK